MNIRVLAIACTATFALACALTALVRALAPRLGAIAPPRPDRWHTRPTALLGGIAIAAAFAAGAAAFARGATSYALPAIAAAAIFCAGLWDDRRHLSPPAKLCIQVAAAALVISAGFQVHWTGFAVVRDAVTFLWLVGLTNAFNLLDNMDGLAAGIAVICAAFLAAAAAMGGPNAVRPGPETILLPALLGAAAAGFLVFNFQPASIFMGDCGSMFLGFSLATLSLTGMGSRARGFVPVLFAPAFLLMLPILDTTLVTVTRTLSGRPVSRGGRDHVSHRLVSLGLSERGAVLLLYGFAALCGVLGLGFGWIPTPVLLFLMPAALLAILAWGMVLGQVRVYPLSDPPPRGALRILVDFTYKRRIMELALDMTLMVLAFYGAFLLRFDGFLPGAQRTLFVQSLPLVLGLEVLVFWAAGMYRGIWHYVNIDDLLGIAGSCILAAALSGAVVLLRHPRPRLSVNVLIVNGMVLLLLVAGSRLAFRILRGWLARLGRARTGCEPVLIYGAGERGAQLVRSLKEFPGAYRAVAVLDDDPHLAGQRLHGCRVVPAAAVAALTRRHGIRQVIISTAKISDERLTALRALDLEPVRIQLPW